MIRNFRNKYLGLTSAAASLKQGTPCRWATRTQSSWLILPAPALKKWAMAVRSLNDCSYCPMVLNKPDAAISQRMVITVAM
jgi:hypothetical protein